MTTTNAPSLRGIFVLALILLLGACSTSRTYTITKLDLFIPLRIAAVPAGTEASIRIQEGAGDRIVKGELIEVRKDGFLILTVDTSELTLLPYGSMVRMRFQTDVGVNRSIRGVNRSIHRSRDHEMPPLQEDQVRQRALARFSRYPFGLDEAQLQRLLEALGQSELVVIES